MKNPFLIIDGGLATRPVSRREPADDKLVRFEAPTHDSETASSHGSSGLHLVDDSESYGLIPSHALGCVLDFEYNGVPARHGFLLD